MLSPMRHFSTKDIGTTPYYHCLTVHFDKLSDRKGGALRPVGEPAEPRLMGTQKHSDHARPVHFDKLSDRKGGAFRPVGEPAEPR